MEIQAQLQGCLSEQLDQIEKHLSVKKGNNLCNQGICRFFQAQHQKCPEIEFHSRQIQRIGLVFSLSKPGLESIFFIVPEANAAFRVMVKTQSSDEISLTVWEFSSSSTAFERAGFTMSEKDISTGKLLYVLTLK